MVFYQLIPGTRWTRIDFSQTRTPTTRTLLIIKPCKPCDHRVVLQYDGRPFSNLSYPEYIIIKPPYTHTFSNWHDDVIHSRLVNFELKQWLCWPLTLSLQTVQTPHTHCTVSGPSQEERRVQENLCGQNTAIVMRERGQQWTKHTTNIIEYELSREG